MTVRWERSSRPGDSGGPYGGYGRPVGRAGSGARGGAGQYGQVADGYGGARAGVGPAPAPLRCRRPGRGLGRGRVGWGGGGRGPVVGADGCGADGAVRRGRSARSAGGVRWGSNGEVGEACSDRQAVPSPDVGGDGGILGGPSARAVPRAAGRQAPVEAAAGPGASVLAAVEPTEPTGDRGGLRHTAVLAAARQQGAAGGAGRLFRDGSPTCSDAVEDLAATPHAAWNPLTAPAPASPRPAAVRRRAARCASRPARHGVRGNSASGRLAHTLLVHELGRSVDRVFARATARIGRLRGGQPVRRKSHAPGDPGLSRRLSRRHPEPPRRRGRLAGCLVHAGLCRTCQLCCCDPRRPVVRAAARTWGTQLADGCGTTATAVSAARAAVTVGLLRLRVRLLNDAVSAGLTAAVRGGGRDGNGLRNEIRQRGTRA